MGKTDQPKTSLGLERNTEAALTYLLGWLTGILFFLLEKKDKVVKFHAVQSTIIFGALTILYIIFAAIPLIGSILAILTFLSTLVIWIVLLVKAYQGEEFKIPVVSDIAEKYRKVF